MRLRTWLFGLLPTPIRGRIRAYVQFQRFPEYPQIASLNVQSSGVTDDDIPYIRLDNGLIFYGYPPKPVQRDVYRYKMDEDTKSVLVEEAFGVACDIAYRYLGPPSSKDYLRRGKYYALNPGDTVIEAGAFLGYYAMRAAQLVGPTGRVIAIEAIDENFELLKKNIKANALDNVTVVNKAVWHRTESITFFRTSRQIASALSTVVSAGSEIAVEADTIDRIAADVGLDRVDFVRIQVNGVEQKVLEGMADTLRKTPNLLIAVPYNQNVAAIERLLQEKGYSITIQEGSLLAIHDK